MGRLPIDLAPLLARAGLPAGECRVLETLIRPGGKPPLRLRGPERQRLKVRSFASPYEAAAMVRLCGYVGEHPGACHILSWWGRHVLEKWVEGLSLAREEPSSAKAQPCGALLADLHSISLPGHGRSEAAVMALVEERRTHLQGLAGVRALTHGKACEQIVDGKAT